MKVEVAYRAGGVQGQHRAYSNGFGPFHTFMDGCACLQVALMYLFRRQLPEFDLEAYEKSLESDDQ